MSLNEFERIVNSTDSPEIGISGGEPTLRDDLGSMIALVKRSGRDAKLLTNGLKLADARYLEKLMNAGLDHVFFSFDSFKNDFYGYIKGPKSGSTDILNLKLKALNNLGKESMPTSLSATIYPHFNDDELMELFAFALARDDFITCVRFRSCYNIGRSGGGDNEGYFGSELLDLFSRFVKIDKRKLLEENLIDEDHSPHHVFLALKGHIKDGIFISEQKAAKRSAKRGLFAMFHKEPPINKMLVRFINWPTIKNIDLQELENGIGQVTKDNQAVNFCLAIILDNFNPRCPELTSSRAIPGTGSFSCA